MKLNYTMVKMEAIEDKLEGLAWYLGRQWFYYEKSRIREEPLQNRINAFKALAEYPDSTLDMFKVLSA